MDDHGDSALVPPARGVPPGETPPGENVSTLLAAAYGDLCGLATEMMRHERPGHALHPLGLVHEAALRLLRPEALGELRGRRWFFGAMANTMRRVLVDHARARRAVCRGYGRHQVPLAAVQEGVPPLPATDRIALDDALRVLGSFSKRQSDVVTLRFLHDLDATQVAGRLGVSVSTVERDWRAARAWLRHRLDDARAGDA